MQLIVTSHTPNNKIASVQSVDGRYRWFWSIPDCIKDTVTGKSIYQMRYTRSEGFGSDPLPADVAEDVLQFWAALKCLQATDKTTTAPPSSEAGDPIKAEKYRNLMLEGGDGFNPYSPGVEV